MKQLLVDGLAVSPISGYMHTGYLEWKLFGPSGYPLDEIVRIWELPGGRHAAWCILGADAFDYQIAIDLRGSDIERDVIAWGQASVLAWRREQGLEPRCSIECFADDDGRRRLIEQLGYRASERGSLHLARSLKEPIPEPSPADGWRVCGLSEPYIDSRAETQYEAFAPGSRTTPETWRHLMKNAPGYDADLDSIAVHDDGTVGAAALVWTVDVNLIGEFEPVGTRPRFQRRGLGRAVMLRGLTKLRERGMRTACVGTNKTNAAAIALYESVGFRIRNSFIEYELAAPDVR